MPSLAFGTGGRFGRLRDTEASKLVSYAIQKGIRCFDTGFEYGKRKSQPNLINTLHKYIHPNSPIKEAIIFSTKFRPCKDLDQLNQWCDSTLQQLKYRDYIDVVFVWGPSLDDLKRQELWERLEQIRNSGKIRSIGINTHDLTLMKYISNNSNCFPIDHMMVDYNILQQNRNPVISEMSSKNWKVWAGTVLCQGFLVQSLPELIMRTRSISYTARSILNKPTRAYLRPAQKARNYLKKHYPETAETIPLEFVCTDHNVSYVPIGMMSKKSIDKNIAISSTSTRSNQTCEAARWALTETQIDEKA